MQAQISDVFSGTPNDHLRASRSAPECFPPPGAHAFEHASAQSPRRVVFQNPEIRVDAALEGLALGGTGLVVPCDAVVLVHGRGEVALGPAGDVDAVRLDDGPKERDALAGVLQVDLVRVKREPQGAAQIGADDRDERSKIATILVHDHEVVHIAAVGADAE